MANLAHLSKLGVVKKYSADEVFFQQGDPGASMYIILTGRVEVLSRNMDGSFVQVAQLMPGDFFGEMSLLEKQPRSATVAALEETIVIELTEANFNHVISRYPEFALNIMKGLSSRVRRVTEGLTTGVGAGEREIARVEAGRSEKPETDPGKKAENEPVQGPGEELCNKPLEKTEGITFFPDTPPRVYSLAADPSHQQYLFEKDTTCPICEKNFPVSLIRSSKLKLKTIAPDLRQCYEDFEPLWYMVWSCPHCGYANFYYQFRQVSELLKRSILNEAKEFQDGGMKVEYSVPRKINEVFKAYYNCYRTLRLAKASSDNMAKFWLRLSWLFQDAGDEEMYCKASSNALDCYMDTYLNTRNTSPEQDSRMCLLLGELNLRLKNYEEALRFYRKAINRRNGNAVINRQAEDRISELVQLNRKKGAE